MFIRVYIILLWNESTLWQYYFACHIFLRIYELFFLYWFFFLIQSYVYFMIYARGTSALTTSDQYAPLIDRPGKKHDWSPLTNSSSINRTRISKKSKQSIQRNVLSNYAYNNKGVWQLLCKNVALNNLRGK